MAGKFAVVFSDPRAFKFFLKTIGKAGLDQYQVVKVAFLRAIGVIDFPVPPNSRMRGTSSNTIRHYYESGLTTTLPIITAAYIEGLDLRAPAAVLDFGCGVGRQLLHFEKNYPALRCTHATSMIARSSLCTALTRAWSHTPARFRRRLNTLTANLTSSILFRFFLISTFATMHCGCRNWEESHAPADSAA